MAHLHKSNLDSEICEILPQREQEGFLEILEREGIREPLVIAVYKDDKGKEVKVLVDGYRRYDIAKECRLEYRVVELPFASREEAIRWRWDTQNARRNWMSMFERIEYALKTFGAGAKEMAAARMTAGKKANNPGEKDIKGRWSSIVGELCPGHPSYKTVEAVERILDAVKNKQTAKRVHPKNIAKIMDELRRDEISISRGTFQLCHHGAINGKDRTDNPIPEDKALSYENDWTKGVVNRILKVDYAQGFLNSIRETCKLMNKRIPEEKVTLYFTSPPYANRINYGHGVENDNSSYAEYLQGLKELAEAAFRTLRPGGRFVWNVDAIAAQGAEKDYHYKRPVDKHINVFMEALGYRFMDEYIWVKSNVGARKSRWGSYQSPSCPAAIRHHESILVYSKPNNANKLSYALDPLDESSGQYWESKEEWIKTINSVWKIGQGTNSSKSKVKHPCPFPKELAHRVIKLYSYVNDWVVDPFSGSGTTCKVAKEMGRRWTGLDNVEHWCAQSSAEIEQIKVE